MSKGKIIQNRDRTNTVLETKNIEVEEVPCRMTREWTSDDGYTL